MLLAASKIVADRIRGKGKAYRFHLPLFRKKIFDADLPRLEKEATETQNTLVMLMVWRRRIRGSPSQLHNT